MPLNSWIKEASLLLAENSPRFRRRRTSRRHFAGNTTLRQYKSGDRQLRSHFESLEDRILPASLVWVGDINPLFQTEASGNTNWDTNTLPASGDQLTFPDIAGDRSLTNDSSNGSAYTLDFSSAGYTVAGNTIALTATGTDLRSTTGSTTIQTPLTLAADTTIEISAGTTTLAGSLSGSGGFTKSGSGELLITANGDFTGNATVSAGTLNLQGILTGGGNLDITSTATFTGNGTFSGPVSVSGTVAPGTNTGTLNTGPLTFNPSSTLQLQINGSNPGQFDALSSSGTVTLDGTLAINLDSAFTPTPGQTFTVISATAITGSFNSLTGLTYPGGMLLPVRTPTSLILIATPLPTGNIAFSVDSNQMAQDLATFFTAGTGSVNITGSVNVAGQTLSGSFSLSKQTAADTSTLITLAAADVSFNLNGQSTNLVSLSSGSGVVLLASSGVAASLSANLAESINGIGLSGTVGLAVNTTNSAINETVSVNGQNLSVSLPAGLYVRISADNATLTTSVTDLTGNFVIETTGRGASREILLGASGLQTFIGDTGLPADNTDDVGVKITNGDFAAVVLANGTFALTTSGTANLTNVTGVTLSGTGFTEINTTGSSVTRTFTIGGTSRSLAAAANTQRFGTRNFRGGFDQFVDVSGDFLVERSVSGGTTTLKVGASSVNAFLGVNQGQASEFGVKLDNVGLGLIIEKSSGTAPKFAVSTTGGTVALAGLPDLDLEGPLALNINQLQRTVDETVATLTGSTIDVDFTSSDAFRRFGGNLDLAIQNFTTASGTFAFEKETSGATTKIKVAGTSVFAFLGKDPNSVPLSGDEVGINITNARFGGVLLHTNSGNSFALDAAGSAELVGVSGLSLSGTMAVRANTTGGAVTETVSMPSGGPVNVNFAADETSPVFKGSITANAAGYASLSGNLTASKSTNRLTFAGAGITAFVGSGDLGVNLTQSKLGVVVKTDTGKFAAVASGNAELTGVTGLTVSGTGSVRINRLGEAINETITTSAGNVTLDFPATDVTQIRSTLNLQFQNFVYASGDFLVEKTTVGDLTTFNRPPVTSMPSSESTTTPLANSGPKSPMPVSPCSSKSRAPMPQNMPSAPQAAPWDCAEGGAYAAQSAVLARNVFTTFTMSNINVSDGRLDLLLRAPAGYTGYWLVCGVDIATSDTNLPPTAPQRLDGLTFDEFGLEQTSTERLAAVSRAGQVLTTEVVEQARREAVADWLQAGLTPGQIVALQNTTVQISDLNSEGAFGFAGTRLIQLDDDALGYGWHVGSGPVPTDAVDLGTVMRHELGHILGLSDLDPATAGNDLMSGTILPGQRRPVPVAVGDDVFVPAVSTAKPVDAKVVDLFDNGAMVQTPATSLILVEREARSADPSSEIVSRPKSQRSSAGQPLSGVPVDVTDAVVDLDSLDDLFANPLEGLFE